LSEIRANTVSDAAGTGPVTLTGQYAAKAWVNFNGDGTVAIRESGNVSSITDSGVGIYTTNLTIATPDANYAVTGSCWNTGGSGFAIVSANSNASIVRTTSAVGILTGDSNSYYDVANVFVVVHR
jgi:hypothetical protein